MAEAAIDALKLGTGPATDFLGVSFSAVDGVGHVYGPRSHEVQDVLVRLDRTIGRLLEHLDAAVGRRQLRLGFSADHGVAEIPEQVGGGRVASKAVATALRERPRRRRSGRERTCCRRRTRTSISTSRRGSGSRRTRRCVKPRWRRCDRSRASSSRTGDPISPRRPRALERPRVSRRGAQPHARPKRRHRHRPRGEVADVHGRHDARHPVRLRSARAGHLLRRVDPPGTVHRRLPRQPT